MAIQVKVKYNNLSVASSNLGPSVGDAITKFIHDVEAIADANTPVDTGTLKDSRTTEIDGLNARIIWHAEYALYVHEGTRFQGSRPFASDAFEKAMPSLEAAFREIEGSLT